MTNLFLNDLPYVDDNEDPLDALDSTLAFSADDWGSSRAMAWVWGIVCGWDDAMSEMAEKFKWDEAGVARLGRLHETFEATQRALAKTHGKLGIIGRERSLIDGLAKLVHAAVWKQHPSTDLREDRRGSHFECLIHLDGQPTGRVARITIELDRVEQGAGT